MVGSWLVPLGLRLICRNKQKHPGQWIIPLILPVDGLVIGVENATDHSSQYAVHPGSRRRSPLSLPDREYPQSAPWSWPWRAAWYPISACQMRRSMGEPMPYHVRIYKRRPRTGLVGIVPCLLLVLLYPPRRETNKPVILTRCGPLLHSLPRWRAPSMEPLSPPRTLMDVIPSRLLASRPRWASLQTVAARNWKANTETVHSLRRQSDESVCPRQGRRLHRRRSRVR